MELLRCEIIDGLIIICRNVTKRDAELDRMGDQVIYHFQSVPTEGVFIATREPLYNPFAKLLHIRSCRNELPRLVCP
ncbi:hypothetical protein AS591_21190 [Stenotrophomonas maltophilia]|nr:hypothetical protein AS591_21190 [Stenotrophomonas maltophilia]